MGTGTLVHSLGAMNLSPMNLVSISITVGGCKRHENAIAAFIVFVGNLHFRGRLSAKLYIKENVMGHSPDLRI